MQFGTIVAAHILGDHYPTLPYPIASLTLLYYPYYLPKRVHYHYHHHLLSFTILTHTATSPSNILQSGRPERVHWKNCVVSEAEEQTLSESFRTAFEPYDFTLK